MQMLKMLYDEIQDAVDRKVPFIIPIGTLEYHARHASCGTDTLVITGCLRELEKEKERLLATLKMTEKTKKEGGMVEVKVKKTKSTVKKKTAKKKTAKAKEMK